LLAAGNCAAGSVSLPTARISRVADKTADCRTCSSTDADAKPGTGQGSTRNTTDSTTDGRATDCPFRSGAGGRTTGEGDNGPDHKNFTHDSNSTDGSPAITAVSMQFLNI
jgi:hypothetical protein